nr:acetyl-CoA carboxylase carboxyltransferase beta [Valeriana officinalis]
MIKIRGESFAQRESTTTESFAQRESTTTESFAQRESTTTEEEDSTPSYKHLWVVCEECYRLNYKRFLKERLSICEGCESHLKMNSSERLELLIDPNTWDPMNEKMASIDPIEWDSEEAFIEPDSDWDWYSDSEEDLIKPDSDSEEDLTDEPDSDSEEDLIKPDSDSEEDLTDEPDSDSEEDLTDEPDSDSEEDLIKPDSDSEEDLTDEPDSDSEEDLTDEPDSDSEEDLIKPDSDSEEDLTDEPDSDSEEDLIKPDSDSEEDLTDEPDSDSEEDLTDEPDSDSEEDLFKPDSVWDWYSDWDSDWDSHFGWDSDSEEGLTESDSAKAFIESDSEEDLTESDSEEDLTESEEILELDFKDDPYIDRIASYQKKTGLTEAIQTGIGRLNSIPVAMGVMEFGFMGGSMGSVVGEKITRLIEYATNQSLPLIIVCASGGARMQEGSLSLMQMAKISSSLYQFQTNQKLFYISILTSPTTGGVTASFGMLGDLIVAEPNAYIAFAGKRVIEQTLNKEVPEGSQETEYLFDKGLFDLVVPRKTLKSILNELFQAHSLFSLNQNSIDNINI